MIKLLTLIDAICALALLITVFSGLHAKIGKRVLDWLMWTRVIIVIAAITALATTLMFFKLHPSLFVGRLIWLLISLMMIEVAFRQKRETFGNPRLFRLVYFVLIVNLFINIW